MVEIREILCPTDFSESSRHALDHAIVFAKKSGDAAVFFFRLRHILASG